MSSTIRPGGPVSPGVTSSEGPSEVEAASIEATPATAMRGVEQAQAASAAAASQAGAVDSPSAALLSRLDAGELTREQAIEGLVAQALETHGGARLPAAQRAELESVLRAALQDDPALASLLG